MTSLNTRYSSARPLPQRPSVALHTVPASSVTGTAQNAPLVVPPSCHSLDSWGGKNLGAGGRVEVREDSSSTATELVLDLH